ncbi:hypothetical protein CUMW_260090, partial [Citrus unshiu]
MGTSLLAWMPVQLNSARLPFAMWIGIITDILLFTYF